MEEEVLKVNITISEEGIVFIDDITADMEALNESINNNSVLMYCESEAGFKSMYENYKAFERLIVTGKQIGRAHV